MSGLVLELQSDALNSNIPVSELLRKALVVSKKLGVSNIEEWLNNELNGYRCKSDIPPYREVHGQIQEKDVSFGWLPLDIDDPRGLETLVASRKMVSDSISALESQGSKPISAIFSPEYEQFLKVYSAEETRFLIPSSQFVGILNTVRNEILSFALKLEEDGILGEGMSFSKEEKNIASKTTYNITNITNKIGNMQNSQIQQHSTGPQTLNVNNELQALIEFLSKLVSCLDSLELEEDSKNELLAEVEAIQLQANSSSPKNGIIFEGLKTIRTILEGAGGNIVANNLNLNDLVEGASKLIEFFHKNISL